ncbi:MAG: Kiwa anti-phage protein KwaB-like domain-containing protein [Rhodoglobus sp.]
MNPDDVRASLLATIDAIEADAASANFLARGSDLGSSDVTSIDFERGVSAEIASDVLEFARTIADREWIPYDPSFQLAGNQALVDELDQVPELARIHAAVSAGRSPLDSGSDEPVVAMVHRVGVTAARSVTAYRVKGPGIATRRPRGIRLFIPRDGVFERIEKEVLYYEPRFDALVVGGHVLVTAITTLQRSLGSGERARTLAAKTFSRATAKIAIDGLDDLTDAVATDPAMVAKMAQLARLLDAEPEYAEYLTTPKLLAFLDQNPQIPITVVGSGDERRLVFEASPQKRYLIPKALADDYLRSDLSDRRYEAGSKHRLD